MSNVRVGTHTTYLPAHSTIGTDTSQRSLNLAPSRAEIPTILSTIDPLKTGVVPFDPFIAYAAIALHTRDDSEGDGDEDEEDEEATPYHQNGDDEEQVREAYMLFTHGGPGPITLAHLRRVARELKEDVPDDVLKDMLREANGGVAGGKDAGGVALEEFEGVMRRAGVSFG